MNSNGSLQHQRELWDRQLGETGKQFAAFIAYRNLDTLNRSLAKVGDLLGLSGSYLERLSSKFDWVKRAEACDEEKDRADQIARRHQIEEMNRRHADISAAALQRVAERLETLDAASLRPNEIARLLEIASRSERMARGILADEPVVVESRHHYRAEDIRKMLKVSGLIP